MDGIYDFATDGRVGSAASVLALAITVVGFVVTIFNVVRSRHAAERAEAAAAGVQRELTRFDAVADVSAAIASMEEIKRLQRQLAWSVLPDRYATLRKHLISIKTTFVELSEPQRATLQNAIQHFAGIEDQIERAPAEGMPQRAIAKLNKTLSAQIDALQEVLMEIRMTR